MNSKEFYLNVREMRALQRDYFKTKDKAILKKCKVLEAIIDKEIQRVDRITGVIREIPKEINLNILKK